MQIRGEHRLRRAYGGSALLEGIEDQTVTLHAGTLPPGVATLFSCDPERGYGPADLGSRPSVFSVRLPRVHVGRGV